MEENVKGLVDEANKVERFYFDSISRWNPEFVSSCFANENVSCFPIALCGLSALLWVIACFLLVCKRCGTKDKDVGDTAACALYCFLGNMSSTVGALLSNQLVIQVFMGVLLAALDVVHFIFIIVPFCLWWHSKSERTMKMMMRKRRRQNLLALSLLLGLGGAIFLWPSVQRWPAEGSQPNRRLLSLILQDNSEILGYALGMLSFVIGWTSKFPSLSNARLGKMSSVVHVSSGVVCALANVLYGLAILIYDAHLKSVLRALPWLLNSFGCTVFEVVILGLSCYSRATDQSGPRAREPADTQCLLEPTSLPRISNQPCLNGTPLRTLRMKKRLQKRREEGQYMDINIHSVQPLRKACLKEVTICRQTQSASQPLKRTERVVRVDDPSNSDSSSVSSTVSSRLEMVRLETTSSDYLGAAPAVAAISTPGTCGPPETWATSSED